MSDDNSQDRDDQSNESDKKQRKFDLKLIVIIVLGLSITFGILIFRQVRKVIQNPPEYVKDQVLTLKQKKGMNREEIRKHFEAHKDQIHQAAKKERLALQGRPIRDISHFIDVKKLKLAPLEVGQISQVREVTNLVALRSEYKDQFEASDILDEKLGRVFVKKDKAHAFKSESVSFNERTRQLGVITGRILMRFKTIEDFEKRLEIYPSGSQEQRVFESTLYSIVEFKEDQTPSFSELLELEKELSVRPELKRVKVEILENGKVPR